MPIRKSRSQKSVAGEISPSQASPSAQPVEKPPATTVIDTAPQNEEQGPWEGGPPQFEPSQVEHWAVHDATPELGDNTQGVVPGNGEEGTGVQRLDDQVTVPESDPTHPGFEPPKTPVDKTARENQNQSGSGGGRASSEVPNDEVV